MDTKTLKLLAHLVGAVLLIALLAVHTVVSNGQREATLTPVEVEPAPRLPEGCVPTDLNDAGVLCVRRSAR